MYKEYEEMKKKEDEDNPYVPFFIKAIPPEQRNDANLYNTATKTYVHQPPAQALPSFGRMPEPETDTLNLPQKEPLNLPKKSPWNQNDDIVMNQSAKKSLSSNSSRLSGSKKAQSAGQKLQGILKKKNFA